MYCCSRSPNMSGDTVFQNHYLRTMKRPHTNLMNIFPTTNVHSHTDVFLNTNFTNNTNVHSYADVFLNMNFTNNTNKHDFHKTH